MHFIEKLILKDLRLTGKIVLTFFSGLAILIFIIHGLIVLGFNYPLDYGEGPLLNQALRLTNGEPLYPTDITSPPYLITNYPPIFILLNAFFVWIFGPSLLIGRLIALLSTIGTAIIIALLINHFFSDQGFLPGLVGASLFLIIPYVLQWSAYFRVDMLALLFSVTGIYIVVNHPEENRSILLAALFFVLAAYTRQSYGLAGPLSAAIWIGIKNRKQAIKLILIYTIAGLVLFGLLQLLSKGGFYFHIITANINPYHWQTVINYALEMYNTMPWILLILAIFLTIGWRYFRSYALLAPFMISSGAAALSIGKVGSNANYLVEISAAFAIVTGVVVGKAWEPYRIEDDKKPDLDFPKKEIPHPESVDPQIRRKMWLNLVIFMAVAAILVSQIIGLTNVSLLGPISNHRNRIKMGIAYQILEKSVKEASIKGPVLADEFMAMLPDHRIPLYIQPFELTQLANANLWDQSRFIESLQKQTFPLILVHHFQFYPVYLERWTQEMQAAIFDHYVAKNIRANSLFFNPKDHENEIYPTNRACSGTPWQIPSEAHMGIFWYNRQLLMMGAGYSGEVPVYAVADGLLYQFSGWKTSVAIQHEDPLMPGKMLWSFYGDLAPAYDAENSYIVERFIGAQAEPVNAGDLIGYQGQWLGPSQQTWVHVRFTLLPADEDGGFPEDFIPIDDYFAPLPSLRDLANLGLDMPLSMTAYTGLPQSNIFGTLVFLPYQCELGGDK